MTDGRVPIAGPERGAPAVRDPRRLGLGAAAIIAGYACVVGLISANAGSGDLGPPAFMPRPLVLAGLLMIPAAIAAVGAWHRSRTLLVIAGVMCLFQSFISFAGVALPFLVPAGLLISLGVSGRETAPRRAALGGLAVIGLWIGAWVATFVLTETVCWVARAGADGGLVYSQIPVTDSYTMGLGEVAQGCDGGVVSPAGVALAAILAIGAIAVAELSARPASERAQP